MNKLLNLLLIPLMVAFVSSAVAQEGGKIAVINPQKAIIQTDFAQSKLAELRKDPSFAENLKEIEEKKKKYDDLAAKIQKDQAVMNQQQLQAEAKKLQEIRADIEFTARKIQAAEQDVLAQVGSELDRKLQTAVEEIVKTQNIGLLLNRQAAVYVTGSYDITSEVTDKLNQSN